MSRLDIDMRFPLLWPEGRPRSVERNAAKWRHEGRALTFDVARSRVRQQLDAMTRQGQPWRTTSVVLSCNIRFTRSGARDQNYSRREPEDVGAALYFDLDERPHVLACDRWDTVADNVAAIAAHIDALRGQERWGVADLAQAFAGHAALPPPEPWWRVLGLDGPTRDEAAVRDAYRRAVRQAHPDAPGGNRAAWDRVTAAFDAAKRELGL